MSVYTEVEPVTVPETVTVQEAADDAAVIEPKFAAPADYRNPVDAATYDARAHAQLPGVDMRGASPHRPNWPAE